MVRKFLVCCLVAACSVAAALDVTRFDGNYWNRVSTANTHIEIFRKPNYTVMLTDPVCVDLRNTPVSYRFRISGQSPVFTFRGENTWNRGPMPASARIYFTDTPGVYSNLASSQQPNRYWWSTAVVNIQRGEFELSTTISPENFTNGIGQSNPEAFETAARNIRQIGISFCGGWFFDVGISVTAGRAECWLENSEESFRISDFFIYPSE